MPDVALGIDPARIEAELGRWPGMAGARATLLHVSENATFRVGRPDAEPLILRAGRPGYRDDAAVHGELAFLDLFLQAAPAPRAVPATDGTLLQHAAVADGTEPERTLVMFTLEPGNPVGEGGSTPELFRRLGAIAAAAHQAVGDWTPPTGFTRPALVPETILPPAGPWGDWRAAPGVDAAIAPILERTEALVRERLERLGRDPDRFGLIHADMHANNLLVAGDRLTVIDFDDCGFSWHLYDLAAALSFIEAHPETGELVEAWLEGYQRRRRLPREHLLEIETLIMLRRLVLLAWLGTRAGTDLAETYAADFAEDSAVLAERFLTARG